MLSNLLLDTLANKIFISCFQGERTEGKCPFSSLPLYFSTSICCSSFVSMTSEGALAGLRTLGHPKVCLPQRGSLPDKSSLVLLANLRALSSPIAHIRWSGMHYPTRTIWLDEYKPAGGSWICDPWVLALKRIARHNAQSNARGFGYTNSS